MSSRYDPNDVYTYTRADGTLITVNGRRRMLVSTSNDFAIIVSTSRIDNASYAVYGDSTEYWAVTDQDLGLDPFNTINDDNIGTSLQFPTLAEINEYES